MKKLLIFVVLFSTVYLVGCVGHYRYESRGSVELSSGQSADAVMYWFADEGRLWYGKPYKQPDSDLEMRICGATPKSFVPDEQTQVLQLLSKSGDMQIVSIGPDGMVTELAEPVRVAANSPCGQIMVDGNGAKITDLNAGAVPAVIFLCKNARNPDRYPNARLYQFMAVSRTEMDGRDAPVPCLSQ